MSDRPTRWTEATVHPDMWADPGPDPRNSEGPAPDGELATLQDYLTRYRLTVRMKCDGLDAERLARRSVPPSTMSLLGLIRHLAGVERDWRNWITGGDPLPKLYGARDADFDGAVAERAAVDAAYADLAREQAATDAALASHPDLGERLGKDRIAVRELLVHRIEECWAGSTPTGSPAPPNASGSSPREPRCSSRRRRSGCRSRSARRRRCAWSTRARRSS